MDNPAGSLVAEFPRERTWLLPALQAVQEIEGWLSSEALAAVAEHFRLPVSEASAIASDYDVFRLVKPGSHLVRVCTGLSCRLTGGADHLRTLENRLGIARGQTTSDDRLTLEEADCLSMCSLAPVLERQSASSSVSRSSDVVCRSEEHTSELQSPCNLVCRLLLEKKN